MVDNQACLLRATRYAQATLSNCRNSMIYIKWMQTYTDMRNNDSPQQDNRWQISQNNISPNDDPLLSCLIILTKMQHRPFSATALTAGLPLVENRLTPELFIRPLLEQDLLQKSLKDHYQI